MQKRKVGRATSRQLLRNSIKKRKEESEHIVDKLWHRFMPGTKEQFLEWLGVGIGQLDGMSFAQLEQLPVLKNLVRPLGGFAKPMGTVGFTWQVVQRGHKNLKFHEKFIGAGGTYNEAALMGIMTMYELVWRRRKGEPLK